MIKTIFDPIWYETTTLLIQISTYLVTAVMVLIVGKIIEKRAGYKKRQWVFTGALCFISLLYKE